MSYELLVVTEAGCWWLPWLYLMAWRIPLDHEAWTLWMHARNSHFGTADAETQYVFAKI